MKRTKVLVLASTILFLAAGCNTAVKQNTPAPTPTPVSQVQQSPYSYQGVEGKTALELLKAKYSVGTTRYSFGEMVTSINGIEADANHFWEFFVNGESSNVGAGQYVTKSTDLLEWKLSEINKDQK